MQSEYCDQDNIEDVYMFNIKPKSGGFRRYESAQDAMNDCMNSGILYY